MRALGLTRSFDLWVDEMVYARLGLTVSQGRLPHLDGHPFFLHPPGGFLFNGLLIDLFGLSGNDMDLALALRWGNAVLGAVTVALGFLLISRVSGTGIAAGCATILAFDPFVLRNNSRLFLETPAIAVTLAGYLLLVRAMSGRGRVPTGTAIAAGLLLGCGVLTKDATVVLAAVPLVLAVVWKQTLHVREAAVVLAAGAVPYLLYLVVVLFNGLLGAWGHAKLDGVERMIGLTQTTGFNAPDTPNLVGRLIDQIGYFGTSYLLLAACPVVGVVAARSAHPARRLVGMCAVAMGALGIYAAAFGTFEEQYGYGVIVTGTLALGAAAAELRDSHPRLVKPGAVGLACLIVLTMALGIRVETTQDNSIQAVRDWVRHNLPADAKVGVTSNTAQWAFADDPRFGVWPSAPALRDNGATYILTHDLYTEQGYSYAKISVITWLRGNATPLATFTGPTNGDTVLWRIDPATLDKAAVQGVGS
ncbi:4-amino-4-deoxy-L-arabinose transferase-like glycosyltransferase [Saccharothrix tamanrassetensis]|uniref:4-amino-4-deoxy-L-arabinose transferase-like glycosyltransferase n=1 Tax=Saccharothrix tamanrassetensis TaxID=1051531 RepID=A0A841CU41_9PSEU|nr:phospholipid carrier-dependent glycosyltransferase [Saccharothrix tamanrassetensis]MBB5959658.1 4-amino-4-deoxy-L-arabinose transferase-like glycosyltransferase [Saccharothrix tamanrassetensis]